jgi:hypothetical protein
MQWNAAATFLGSRTNTAADAWLRAALDRIDAQSPAITTFEQAWAAAGRTLGQARLAPTPDEERTLAFSPAGFCGDEYGRALLLLAVLSRQPPSTHLGLVDDLLRTGELREQQAVLRALPHLPGPERFVSIAIAAARANAVSVIESIACENPYPTRYFPEAALNQLVLKCLFCGVSLQRMLDLPSRITPELKRMVAGFASEQRAAGRTVPEDTNLILEGDAHAPV